MKIIHITNTDPAGSVYNFMRATNEHTSHRARLITTNAIPQFEFPRDIMDIFDSGDEAEALLRDADVIHLHKVDDTLSTVRHASAVMSKKRRRISARKVG